jgi:hypothetical protein
MAQAAQSPRPVRAGHPAEPAKHPAPTLSLVLPVNTDLKADPKRPTVGVHPAAIKIALAAAVWFVAAAGALFSSGGNAYTNYPLAIVAGLALVFFGLTLGLARRIVRDKRWSSGGQPTFARFVEDNVAIETGTIAAREALTQIVTLPIVLAAGLTAIGVVLILTERAG